MAISQINSAAFDYDMMLSFIEGTNIGKANITLSEFDSDAAPVVKVGSKFEVNGALFKVLTADETPSGYAGIANSTTFYIMYDVSGEEFVFTSVAPTWNDALQGWYESGQTDRYFFRMFKDSGGTLYSGKGDLRHIKLGQKFTMQIGDWDMDATTNVSIPHGLNGNTNITMVTAFIKNDDDTARIPINGMLDTTSSDLNGGVAAVTATIVQLFRFTGGSFDGTSYNATSYNRGWITVWYTDL